MINYLITFAMFCPTNFSIRHLRGYSHASIYFKTDDTFGMTTNISWMLFQIVIVSVFRSRELQLQCINSVFVY